MREQRGMPPSPQCFLQYVFLHSIMLFYKKIFETKGFLQCTEAMLRRTKMNEGNRKQIL